MFNYPNLLAGAKGLLGDCVEILSQTNFEYVIVGGWSPLLLNSNPIQHPGTHDVDLLFKDAEDTNKLEEVFKMFLSKGYMPSAKHNFQLLKILQINSQKFVYNVDILHTSHNDEKGHMFVDHFKLPIPLSSYGPETYMQMSIKAPNSDVIFTNKLYESVAENFILFDGSSKKINLPLLNEAGLIITKSESLNNVKRKRDAFDIYLSIKQARDYSKLVEIFTDLKYKDPKTFNALYGIKNAVTESKMITNILEYVFPNNVYSSNEISEIEKTILNFFTDVTLEEQEKLIY